MAVRMNMHPTNLSFKDFFKKRDHRAAYNPFQMCIKNVQWGSMV